MQIPIDQIDETAIPRDRTLLDPAALDELRLSINATGVRLPIEVYQTDTGYALISGLRRLTATRDLFRETGDPRFATIPAILRDPVSRAQAMAQMVEENDLRQDLSPWERSLIAAEAAWRGDFDTIDAAIAALYPHADRNKRGRIRTIATVIEHLGDLLADPEGLSQNKLLRIAAAISHGWTPLIRIALEESKARDHRTQWALMLPILDECEHLPTAKRRWDRPRRICRPRPGIVIRREKVRDGFVLYVTGRQANDFAVEAVFEEVERLFEKG